MLFKVNIAEDTAPDPLLLQTKERILEWLGQEINPDFLSHLSELKETKDITLCGETGEYHTFVTDGPLFKQRIEILETNKVLRDGHWFLQILNCDLRAK